MTDINVMTTYTRLHLAAQRARAIDDGETARAIVRAGLTGIRVALGETTHAAETYKPRHSRARWDAAPVTTGREAGA